MIAATSSGVRLAAAILIILIAGSTASAQQTSDLWGETGELWDPAGRLPDVSYAGYRRGEATLPTLPVAADVRDFGAVGDGEHDDTEALRRAIAATDAGAILLPAGLYRITSVVDINKPGIVLRGEGVDQTTLYFPRPLEAVKSRMTTNSAGRPTSHYSWSGGFLRLHGDYANRVLTPITGPARRGARRIRVASPESLKVGDTIQILLRDDADQSLVRHLYSEDPGPIDDVPNQKASLVCNVVSIRDDQVEIDRPLRFDIRPEWSPQVRQWAPQVRGSGIESMTFEFPPTDYGGHFTEQGYNAIAFGNVADCWVRDIKIVNADSGLFVRGWYCTIDGVVFESSRKPDRHGATGHHGATIGGQDMLYTRFDYRTRFIHDITVSHSAGNVISNGRGVDLSLDHHKRSPYDNVFTNLDAGAGRRLWRSGGGKNRGRHCGARGTFWNIRAQRPLGPPPPGFGPASMNVVGLTTVQPGDTSGQGVWFEAIDPGHLTPANIHEAQQQHRLASTREDR